MNSKLKLYYYVDLLFFITLAIAAITGVILWGWLRPAGMVGPGGPPQTQAIAKDAPTPSSDARAHEGKGERVEQSPQNHDGKNAQVGQARIFWGLLHGNSLLGMSKGVWKDVHCWDSVVMVVLMIVHLCMHAKWIANATNQLRQKDAPKEPVGSASK
ncbi:MAG: DUF4405 domain-containing protein [Thermoguttaceae bacterium]|nr:DUF4405 domain-containing protein [Thermoguttaceae bacterium]